MGNDSSGLVQLMFEGCVEGRKSEVDQEEKRITILTNGAMRIRGNGQKKI